VEVPAADAQQGVPLGFQGLLLPPVVARKAVRIFIRSFSRPTRAAAPGNCGSLRVSKGICSFRTWLRMIEELQGALEPVRRPLLNEAEDGVSDFCRQPRRRLLGRQVASSRCGSYMDLRMWTCRVNGLGLSPWTMW